MISLLASLVLIAAPVPKDKADEELQKKADIARAKAVKFLKEKQEKDGSWESAAQQIGMNGGVTALAALALLEAGVPANDPNVAKAVEYLLTVKPEWTYVVSLQTQVLARADAKKYAKEIQANVDWLLDKAIVREKKFQGWSYSANAIADNSNTHFAIMALHAAAQAGAKVDPDIWPKIRDFYAETQKADGGWTYTNVGDTNTSTSMTVNALLALTVATKYDKQAKGPDRAFEKGMGALLDENSPHKLGYGKSSFTSWMAVAELGRALGTTEFKSGKMAKAWYREGVEAMAKAQQEDGALRSGGGGIDATMPVVSTACGLYFLGPPKK